MEMCCGILIFLGLGVFIYGTTRWTKHILEHQDPPPDREEGDDLADLVILDCLLHGDDPFDN